MPTASATTCSARSRFARAGRLSCWAPRPSRPLSPRLAGGHLPHRDDRERRLPGGRELGCEARPAVAAGDPSTPITTGRPGPGVRAGPVGTSTTGQQAWAMTVRDLAPSSAEVKAPCSARPSTSRLACRDASTMAPAAPPVAGKLLACTPGPHRQRAETPSSATARAWSRRDVPQVLGARARPHGHGRVVHGGEHLQAGVPLGRGRRGPVDRRGGRGGAVVADDDRLRAQRLAGPSVAVAVSCSAAVMPSRSRLARAPGQGRRSSAPAVLVVSRIVVSRPDAGHTGTTARTTAARGPQPSRGEAHHEL